jgi:hypothetical protein
MSNLRYIFALSALVANGCLAQTFTFDPPNPQPGQDFTIKAIWPYGGSTVKTQGYLRAPISEGGGINVWFVQDGIGFDAPPPGTPISQGASQVISGLDAGTYTVTISWIPDPGVAVPANSPQTFRLVVGGDPGSGPPEGFAIGNGITGNWYDPDQSGHGFSLEVLPGGTLLAEWFVYAPGGGHDWILATGPINGNTATLNAVRTDGPGGLFPPLFDAATVQEKPWGTATFTFDDCNNGTVSWQSTIDGYGSGSLPITRLTMPAGQHCP